MISYDPADVLCLFRNYFRHVCNFVSSPIFFLVRNILPFQLSTNTKDLQMMLARINTYIEENGLKINLRKIKYMVLRKKPKLIQRQYQYQGTIVNEENVYTAEINRRREIARSIFVKMKNPLIDKSLSIDLRVRIVRCFSTMLYGTEAWTLKKTNIKKLDAFELCLYRRLLRIPWTDRVTNYTVLQRMGKENELLYTIKKK